MRMFHCGSSIVVSGGPAQLRDQNSPLLASPALLIRPLLCLSGPYNGSSILRLAPLRQLRRHAQSATAGYSYGSGFIPPNQSR